MSLEGMDVDQAQRLAQQLNGNTQALIHITGALGALTEELSYQWRGPASGTFQQQWSTQYQGALSRAAQTLTDMHTHLVANIRQQVQASDTDPGGGGTAGFRARAAISGLTLATLLSGASSVWGAVKGGNDYFSMLDGPLRLARNANVVGRYDKTWTRVIHLANDSSLLKYKRSPFLHWFHDNPHVQEASSLLEKMPAHDFIGRASGVVSDVAAGQQGLQGLSDIGNHHYAAAGGQMVDATASVLKGSRNPVLYLAGVDVSLIHRDYDLASQVNWSDIPNPLDPGVFRNDYVPSFKQLPGEVWDNLKDGIF
jgi:uncharacterized protein YukE